MTQDTFLDWHPRNPFRPPDWRWRRGASMVAAKARLSRKYDDEATRRVIAFLRASEAAVTDKTYRKTTLAFPDLFAAFRLHRDGGQRQLELECRVLARQPSELIAELMALPLQAVNAYRTVFFDLEGRLDASAYILRTVIGLEPLANLPPASWMRALAYHHGPHVIEPFFDYLEHASETHDLRTPEGRRREAISIFLAVQALALDASSAPRFLRLPHLIFERRESLPEYVPTGALFASLAERSLMLYKLQATLVTEKSSVSRNSTPKDTAKPENQSFRRLVG